MTSIAELAAMIAARGAEQFLRPRLDLLLPTERFFPDPWERSLVGVGRLLHRLLHYAGLGDWQFSLLDDRPPLDSLAEAELPTRTQFVDIADGRLVFAVSYVGGQADALARLAQEVALASVMIEDRHSSPYRAAAAHSNARSTEELFHDETYEFESRAAMAYLGFSVLQLMGDIGLISSHPSYMLALQITAIEPERGRDVLAELAPHLAPLHRKEVAAWLEQMAPDAAQIREWLGLPAVEDWPAPQARELGPKLDDETEATLVAAEQAHRHPKRGETVRVYTEHPTVSYTILGLAVGLIPCFTMLVFEQVRWLWWSGLLVGGVVGALIGSRKLVEYCSGCGMIPYAGDTLCRKCGATLGERVSAATAIAAARADEED